MGERTVMGEAWPLTGRDEELRIIGSRLLRPDAPGILLSGAAGTGKSRLAVEAMDAAAANGHPVERVVASRAAASIPFGAFAAVLPPGPADEPALVRLRRGADALAARCERRRLVLVVDDAHLLDDASTTLLQRIMLDGHVFVIATARSGDPVPESVVALWKDVQAERLEVQPLSRDESTQLVEAALAGPLDATVAQRLWTVCGGNPLHLRELVLAQLQAGNLVAERGLWVLTAPGLELPSSLRELIGRRLEDLPSAAVAAAGTLAVADSLGLDSLVELHGRTAVEELERRGLVEIGEDGRRRPVRLAHPFHGELLRQRAGQARVVDIGRRLADLLEGHGARRRGDVLELATWRLHGGGDLDPALLETAARQAYQGGDFGLAERLARLALAGADQPHEARLLLGQILHERGRHEEAERVYAALTATELPGPERSRALLQRSVNLFFGMGRADTALSLLREAAASDADAAGELDANRAWLTLNAGHPAQALELVQDHRDDADPDTSLMAHVTTAWALAYRGRPMEALRAADEAIALRSGRAPTRLNRFRDLPELPRAIALLEDGDLAGAEQLVRRGHEVALGGQPPFVQAWWMFLLGRVHLRAGRPRSASNAFRQSATLQARLHQPGLLRRDLAGIALGHALTGDVAGAAAALEEHDAVGGRPERLHDVLGERARAWLLEARGEHQDAIGVLAAAAETASRAGLGAQEGDARHDLARLGAPELASERLAVLAHGGGMLASLRARHARALAEGDHEELAGCASELAAGGALLLAAEAYAEAAAAATRAGAGRHASRSRREVARLVPSTEGARTPPLRFAAEAVPLTPREREVAALAATGAPSRQIADRLGISRRTVDNLLQRCYGKLGVRSREELPGALDRTPSGG